MLYARVILVCRLLLLFPPLQLLKAINSRRKWRKFYCCLALTATVAVGVGVVVLVLLFKGMLKSVT